MKTFTKIQKERFLQYIKDGILDCLEDCDLIDISEKVNKLDEGLYWRKSYDHANAILAADECGELGELAQQSIKGALKETFDIEDVINEFNISSGKNYAFFNKDNPITSIGEFIGYRFPTYKPGVLIELANILNND